MASSGNIYTSVWTSSKGNGTRGIQLSWTSTQSIETNSTTISWKAVGFGTYGASNNGWVECEYLSITINGTNVYNKSPYSAVYIGTQLASGSLVIKHNDDGTKTDVTFSIVAAIYDGVKNKTGSATYDLDPIQSASIISFDSPLTIGTASTITIERKNTNYVDTISYEWGETTGTIVTNTSEGSISWTPPSSFGSYIPNTTSGTGTFICETYDGTTKIGTNRTRFTCQVPSGAVPTISNLKQTINNTNETIKAWGIAVVGYSTITITGTGVGILSSTVSSFNVNDNLINGNPLSYTTSTLLTSGERTFSIVAVDSRNRTSETYSLTNTVYNYTNPTIKSFTVERNTEDTTKVDVTPSWEISNVNNKNFATISLQYKLSSDSTWTTLSDTLTNETKTTLTTTFSDSSSYNIKLVVTDSVGNSVEKSVLLQAKAVTLDFGVGGTKIGIGKIAENDGLDIAWDITNAGTITNNGAIINNGTITNNANITDEGILIMNNNINIQNGKNIKGRTSSGTYFPVVQPCNSTDNTIFGNLTYSNTYLYGKDIYFNFSNNNTSDAYKPYYSDGDILNYSSNPLVSTGFVTNAMRDVFFSIPICKPVVGASYLKVTGGMQIRQGGSYTHGSAGTGTLYSNPDNWIYSIQGGCISIRGRYSNLTNAANNDLCGIYYCGTITFHNTSQNNFIEQLGTVTTTTSVTVRQSASSSGTSITTLNSGTTVPYYELSNGWYKVRYDSNYCGWISSSYAKIDS